MLSGLPAQEYHAEWVLSARSGPSSNQPSCHSDDCCTLKPAVSLTRAIRPFRSFALPTRRVRSVIETGHPPICWANVRFYLFPKAGIDPKATFASCKSRPCARHRASCLAPRPEHRSLCRQPSRHSPGRLQALDDDRLVFRGDSCCATNTTSHSTRVRHWRAGNSQSLESGHCH